MSGAMLAAWRARNATQVRRISQAVDSNLELQMLVMNTIDQYETAKRKADDAGETLESLSKKTTRMAVVSTPDGIFDGNIPTAFATLGKSRVMLKAWFLLVVFP